MLYLARSPELQRFLIQMTVSMIQNQQLTLMHIHRFVLVMSRSCKHAGLVVSCSRGARPVLQVNNQHKVLLGDARFSTREV